MRKTINGDLVASKRSAPPDCPEGYLRDTTDAYRFIPIRVECEYRTQTFYKKACCGGGTTKTYCMFIGRITLLTCDKCKGNKEWAIEYQKNYG